MLITPRVVRFSNYYFMFLFTGPECLAVARTCTICRTHDTVMK